MNIGKYIFSLLSNDAAVSALVGDRIYPVLLPQEKPYPAIVYSVQNVPHDIAKDRPSTYDRSTVTFHVWADFRQGQQAYEELEAIEAALRAALDHVEGTQAGVKVESCHFDSGKDGMDEGLTLFLKELTYTFISRN